MHNNINIFCAVLKILYHLRINIPKIIASSAWTHAKYFVMNKITHTDKAEAKGSFMKLQDRLKNGPFSSCSAY